MKKKSSGGPGKEVKQEKAPVKKKMTPQGKSDKSSLRNLSRYSYGELSDMDDEMDDFYGGKDDEDYIDYSEEEE